MNADPDDPATHLQKVIGYCIIQMLRICGQLGKKLVLKQEGLAMIPFIRARPLLLVLISF